MKIQALIKHYLEFGEPDKALTLLRELVRLDPKNADIRSEYLYTLHFANTPQKEIFREHLKFSQDFEKKITWKLSFQVKEKIRIGYISPDLCAQASRYCLEPITANHNKELFEVFVYCNSLYHDQYTERFRSHADAWREIQGMRTEDIVKGIKDDKIDILIDMAGHTSLNNMPVFMQRAAPIQISWFGYMDTTGLSNMDHRFTDEWRVPRNREKYYSEKLIYLPNSYTFTPYEDPPQITPPPITRNGYVTFGSLNSTQKNNNEVFKLWAEALRAVPNSRLMMICPRDDSYVRTVLKKFSNLGIDPARIIPKPRSSMPEFLENINNIDIALDPFPYTGGVTTYHALSMGVPSVTLEGTTEFERNCAAIMREAGIEAHTIAHHSKQEYIQKAVELSENPEILLQFRIRLPVELRQREKDTVKHVESALLRLINHLGA